MPETFKPGEKAHTSGFDFGQLIHQSESQTLEFKRSLNMKREGLESLCAMVNTDTAYGIVIFGVEDTGTICGIDEGNLDKAQRSLSQSIASTFDPPIIFNIEIGELNGRYLLGLEAKRSMNIPYFEYDGRALIREGTTNRRLSLAEKQQLERRRNRDLHTGPWMCDRCGTFVGSLTSVVLTNQGMKKAFNCSCGGEFWPA